MTGTNRKMKRFEQKDAEEETRKSGKRQKT